MGKRKIIRIAIAVALICFSILLVTVFVYSSRIQTEMSPQKKSSDLSSPLENIVLPTRSPAATHTRNPPESPAHSGKSVNGVIIQLAGEGFPEYVRSELSTTASTFGYSIQGIGEIGFGLYKISISPAMTEEEARSLASSLALSEGIEAAEPDYPPVSENTEDPDLSSSSKVQQSIGPENSWGIDRIDQRSLPLDGNYSYDTSGRGVRIYIVDTGIYSGHSEFFGRLLPGFDGLHDGRGTEDCSGHGTHVAGIAAGTTFGVAKNAFLVPVRVLNCSGAEGSSSLIIQGLAWIYANHPATTPGVVNLSLTMNGSAFIDSAAQHLIDKGLTVVAASGNSGNTATGEGNSCLYSPARLPGVITVNWATAADNDASQSNYGPCSDIYAPGDSIRSAAIGSSTATRLLSGTSMAAPHVTGVAARILSLSPNLSPAQVWDRINITSTHIDFGNSALGDPNKLLFASSQDTDANYVRNLYRDFLGRSASDNEVSYWVNELASGRHSPRTLTYGLAQSDEYIRSVISGFYVDTLGRQPDTTGLSYWTEKARTELSMSEIGSRFFASDEYFTRVGRGDISVWTADLYLKLLGRTPDQVGLNYWISEINSGRNSKTDVTRGFFNSPEKLRLRVESLYQRFLGRNADPQGIAHWVERLPREGDLSLASSIATSTEYFNRQYR